MNSKDLTPRDVLAFVLGFAIGAASLFTFPIVLKLLVTWR